MSKGEIEFGGNKEEMALPSGSSAVNTLPPNPHQNDELRAEIQHLFASAWQDGVHHLNPKYLRRDTEFTDRVLALIQSYGDKRELEGRIDELERLPKHRLYDFHENEVYAANSKDIRSRLTELTNNTEKQS